MKKYEEPEIMVVLNDQTAILTANSGSTNDPFEYDPGFVIGS